MLRGRCEMPWLIILAFSVSSSIDNLGIGISYGIRGIRIAHLSNLIIALICFVFSEAGILFGKWLSVVLPGAMPTLIGALLLFVIGIRIVLLTIPRKNRVSGEESKSIFKNPELADIDKSGDIGFVESVSLGIALSSNAVTNGLSAGLLGFSPHVISLAAAIASYLTVWAGVALGRKMAAIRVGSLHAGQLGTMISGVILVVIAVHSLF